MKELVTWLRQQIDNDEQDAHAADLRATQGALLMLVERTLAEVDAKRRILDEAERYSPELEQGDNGTWAFETVLRLLAMPYADRPGYREQWRPLTSASA